MKRLVLASGLLGLVLLASASRADDVQYHGGVAPAQPASRNQRTPSPKNPGGDCPRPTDPVELDSGGFFITPQDLTTPDLVVPVRGHTIDLRRSYSYHYAYNGPLGIGWDFAMNRRLRQLDNGDLLLTTGTCRSDEFIYTGTNWITPSGVFASLVQNTDGSYTETFASGLEHHFDTNGSLVQIRDRHGNAISLTYSAQKMPIQGVTQFFVDNTPRVVTLDYRLLTITDPTGRVIQFGYDPTGHIQTIADWTGRVWSYGYDTAGDLIQVTSPGTSDFPQGTSTTYVYGDSRFPNAITSVVSPNLQGTGAALVTNTYDPQGRVIRQDHADGGIVLLSYDTAHSRTTVTDANGTQKIYTLADQQVTSETIVTRGVRPGSVEPVGTQYTTAYSYTQDQRTLTIFPEGNAVERTYDTSNTDPKARGNLLQMARLPKPGSSAAPLVTTFTYKTPYQQIGTITDPAGKVTQFFYDANSDLQSIQFPSVPEGSPQQTFTVNAFGQVSTMTDENGHTTRFVYDANGYLDQVIRADGTSIAATTEFDPDPLGRPTVLRDANGHATSLVYNPWDKLEMSFAPPPFGYETQLHYDADGNPIQIDRQSELAGNPQTTVLGYTPFDQVSAITDELGETTAFGYDLNHNGVTVRDAEQNTTTTVFDERDLPYQTTDAESHVTRLNYHPNATLAQVIDGNGNATGYASDDFDRLSTITYADSSTEIFHYDANSNLQQKTTRAGQPINFTYDDRNRLRTRASPTETATFAYFLGGQMSHAQNSAATLDFGYDARDDLTSETTNIAGLPTQIVSHQYDLVGNRTQLTYPDGAYVSYVYDELNRLHILRDDQNVDQVTYTYDELSRITHMVRASGVTSDYSYDRVSRVKTITHTSPTAGVLEALSYDYNPSGTVQHMTDHNGLHVFGYDKTYQLTSVDYPDASPFPDITYHYDAAGNRISTITAAGTVAYTLSALNEYTSVGGVQQTYDANGNLTGDGANTYSFDAENRLLSATGPGGTAAYEYDAFGRRVYRTVAGTVSRIVWAGNEVIAEYDGTGLRQLRYVNDSDFSSVQVGYQPGTTEPRFDIGSDSKSTPRVVTDSAGAASWRSDYEAFGGLRVDPSSTSTLSLRFAGQHADSESGLSYSRFRYYRPTTASYLTSDPIERPLVTTPYGYGDNDPIATIDPYGLWVIGGGFSLGGTLGVSTSTQYEFVFDGEGNVGFTDTTFLGLGSGESGGVSAVVTGAWSNKVSDLAAGSFSAGGTGNTPIPLVSAGGDVNFYMNGDGSLGVAADVRAGLGPPGTPEGHVGLSKTEVYTGTWGELLPNAWEYWKNFFFPKTRPPIPPRRCSK
jgi:RHS repeat-associated protein